MNWKELLKEEIETNYRVTENLFDLVDEDKLDWKPGLGKNWLKTGQLLYHITESCGVNFKGFVTGNWNFPGADDADDKSPEELLSLAEKFPSVSSINEAKELLQKDKKLAVEMLSKTNNEDLSNKMIKAPWKQEEKPLGYQLLYMIDHLKQHKGQLYYYLKLQGKDVHSGHLWG